MATKAQRDRIKAIMESDGYSSADQMATAILEKAGEILAEGDGWIGITRIPVSSPFPFTIWGPFSNKNMAKRLMKAFDGAVVLYPIKGVDSLAHIEAITAPPAVSDKVQCLKCEHLKRQHWPVGSKGCLVGDCPCKESYMEIYKR